MAYELGQSRGFDSQLLVIRDVLPRAAAARKTAGRREVGAQRSDPVRRRLDDFDCCRDDAFAAARIDANTNALVRNREWNRDAPALKARHAVARRVERFDLDCRRAGLALSTRLRAGSREHGPAYERSLADIQ